MGKLSVKVIFFVSGRTVHAFLLPRKINLNFLGYFKVHLLFSVFVLYLREVREVRKKEIIPQTVTVNHRNIFILSHKKIY